MPFAKGLLAWSSKNRTGNVAVIGNDAHHWRATQAPLDQFHSHLRLLWLCIILPSLLSLSACTRQSTSVATSAPRSIALTDTAFTEESIASSFWGEAAQPFQGTSLLGISEDSPPSLYIRDVLAPAFTAETGIAVELQISNNSTIEQVIATGGAMYDFVYVEQDVIYGYLEHQQLVNLTALLEENHALQSPSFNLIDFTDFIDEFMDPATGDLYGVPIEAFIKPYLYRIDLFTDPALVTAFSKRYHYPLAPAVTFQQYRDIAEFFYEYGRATNLPLWGTAVQAKATDTASFYEFFETIAPAFGVYQWGINLDVYAATEANGGWLDSDRAVTALQFWVDLLAYAPPEATASGWNEVAESFAAGRTAQAWVYGEHISWIATDPLRSEVVGKVGVALPPTAPGVMEEATIGTGSLGYYDGAAFGIPVNSQNKVATLLWLQYLGQASVQPDWATASGRIVHFSTFDNSLIELQDERLNGYYSLMKEHGYLFAGAPPLPFHVQVRDSITPYIHQAIRHELTPADALHAAALAVDAELTRLGYRDR